MQELSGPKNHLTSRNSPDKDFFTYLYQMRLAETTARFKTTGSEPMPTARCSSDLHMSELGDHQFIQALIVLYHWYLAFGSAQELVQNEIQNSIGPDGATSMYLTI
jgi:hypothetical protein